MLWQLRLLLLLLLLWPCQLLPLPLLRRLHVRLALMAFHLSPLACLQACAALLDLFCIGHCNVAGSQCLPLMLLAEALEEGDDGLQRKVLSPVLEATLTKFLESLAEPDNARIEETHMAAWQKARQAMEEMALEVQLKAEAMAREEMLRFARARLLPPKRKPPPPPLAVEPQQLQGQGQPGQTPRPETPA